jgi:hypothetical protein
MLPLYEALSWQYQEMVSPNNTWPFHKPISHNVRHFSTEGKPFHHAKHGLQRINMIYEPLLSSSNKTNI